MLNSYITFDGAKGRTFVELYFGDDESLQKAIPAIRSQFEYLEGRTPTTSGRTLYLAVPADETTTRQQIAIALNDIVSVDERKSIDRSMTD